MKKTALTIMLLVAIAASPVCSARANGTETKPVYDGTVTVFWIPAECREMDQFLQVLKSELGLEEGENLRTYPIDVADPRGIQSQIAEALSSGKCDVIAVGCAGAFLPEAMANGLFPEGLVNQVILISSPLRGSIAASIVWEMDRITSSLAAWERATFAERVSPDKSWVDPYGSKPDASDPPEAIVNSEEDWILYRATRLYLPLYAQYARYTLSQSDLIRGLSFEGFVASQYPELWADVTVESREPLFPGSRISRAYYELVAMKVARSLYIRESSCSRSLVDEIASKNQPSKSLKEFLMRYAKIIVAHYAREALYVGKSILADKIADYLVSCVTFGCEDRPFLESMVKEEIMIDLGPGARERFIRIPARAGTTTERRIPGIKYVALSSSVPNLWKFVRPEASDNDLFVEVDACVPELIADDEVSIVRKGFSATHDKMCGGAHIGKTVSDLLLKSQNIGSLADTARLSSYRPTIFRAETSGEISLLFGRLLPGWSASAWRLDEDGSRILCSSVSGELKIPVEKDCLYAVRLSRVGPLFPVVSNRSVGSAFEDEVSMVAWVQLRSAQDGYAAAVNDVPDLGALESAGSKGLLEGDLPLVRVVYRNKRTTLKTPYEARHVRWEIEFGDGSKESYIQDDLEVGHSYSEPGRYELVAKSIGQDGEIIFQRKLAVGIDSPGEVKRFRFEPLTMPKVTLELTGPLKWVTGRPAKFQASWHIETPANCSLTKAELDPGPSFLVVWERAGEFNVSCALSVQLTYIVEDTQVTLKNTYVQTIPVTVLAIGLDR